MYCTKKKEEHFFKENYYIMILVARCMVDLYHFISKILPIPGNTVKLFPYLIFWLIDLKFYDLWVYKPDASFSSEQLLFLLKVDSSKHF